MLHPLESPLAFWEKVLGNGGGMMEAGLTRLPQLPIDINKVLVLWLLARGSWLTAASGALRGQIGLDSKAPGPKLPVGAS